MRRGQRRADRFRRISISRAVTKQPCGSVVGRLLDTFDKDASGVFALQHSATFDCTAMVPPWGCPDRLQLGRHLRGGGAKWPRGPKTTAWVRDIVGCSKCWPRRRMAAT